MSEEITIRIVIALLAFGLGTIVMAIIESKTRLKMLDFHSRTIEHLMKMYYEKVMPTCSKEDD